MRKSTILALAAGLAALAACGRGRDAQETAETPAPEALAPTAVLDAVVDSAHRSEEERARDQYRHPRETLLFFGAEPDMTIVEIWPGGGWYANVIAPFLAQGGGVYYAAHLDPAASARAGKLVAAFKEKFQGDPALYGTVHVTALSDPEIAPPDSADMVLTFRNVHNWLNNGTAEENFRKFYAALKPGGVLGVVEHRAPQDAPADFEGSSGYVKESTVIALAEAAGFAFEAASEINANPADTKDHPFGVWTLPPTRRTAAIRGTEDPDFDRTKYDAIGESDRMTLKFRKPLGADGALLE
ncbi:MAG: class I SAM-dependent methyltransferase [Amphiplicatus sp.]